MVGTTGIALYRYSYSCTSNYVYEYYTSTRPTACVLCATPTRYCVLA